MCISLDIMWVEVTPMELDVNPIFVTCCAVQNILILIQKIQISSIWSNKQMKEIHQWPTKTKLYSTCKLRTTRWPCTMSSSCNSFKDGLFLSELSQFARAQVLDQTPDTNPWPHSHELVQISLREFALYAKNWLTFLPQMDSEDLD